MNSSRGNCSSTCVMVLTKCIQFWITFQVVEENVIKLKIVRIVNVIVLVPCDSKRKVTIL